MIVALGGWVLRTACGQGAAWQHEFPQRAPYINVNVSTRQLHDPEFPTLVAAVLRDSGLSGAQLVLEITESVLPDDSQEMIDQLLALKALGVRVAVDDFGSGYSALSRLQAYPVDILKIDRSFIAGLENDASKGQLVQGIVNLGESLHLEIVAEGIEEREQADQLREMRSPLGQGFLFSRPIAPAQMGALLAAGVRWTRYRQHRAANAQWPLNPNLVWVRLEGIQTGDIVEVDRLGRRFYALITGSAPAGLAIQPLDRRITYRSCRAHEVVAHWSKRGRPRATEAPLEPSVLQLGSTRRYASRTGRSSS